MEDTVVNLEVRSEQSISVSIPVRVGWLEV